MNICNHIDDLKKQTEFLLNIINYYFDTNITINSFNSIVDGPFDRDYRIQLISKYSLLIQNVLILLKEMKKLKIYELSDGTKLKGPRKILICGTMLDEVKDYVDEQEGEIGRTLELAKQILTEQGLIDEEGDNGD